MVISNSYMYIYIYVSLPEGASKWSHSWNGSTIKHHEIISKDCRRQNMAYALWSSNNHCPYSVHIEHS